MAKHAAKKSTKRKKTAKKPIESYDHKAKQRANNPPAGLVTEELRKQWAPNSDALRSSAQRHGRRTRPSLCRVGTLPC